MATVNPDIFGKFRRAKKLQTRQEGDGHEIEVEVREDEEQSVKLQEIIEILVAAGYFRARIKGLSPFDKVVGGMTWCIESCNVDVDVDLLFQENSTIGQKIALTETIVRMLLKMKCPHRIEPHQIQGLDFIHIFPVIQWLVKTSMEFRQEMSKAMRSFAVNQFNKHSVPDNKHLDMQAKILRNVNTVNEMYRPRRYYKRKNAPPSDIATRVQVTLLEYGHRGIESHGIVREETSEEGELEAQKAQEQKIEQLLNSLSIRDEEDLDHPDLSEEDLEKLAKHYTSLQLEFQDGGRKSQEEKQIPALQAQIKLSGERCAKLEEQKNALEVAIKGNTAKIQETRLKQREADKTLKELEETEIGDTEKVKEVEDLIVINDNLKAQEVEFREHCRSEVIRLQNLICEARGIKPSEESRRSPELKKELEDVGENVKKVRTQLAKKNRIVSGLQRHLDDIPNRPELAQYQRRFLELYNQVSAKHKETKQYYTLYNTLVDTRQYMKKELSLLNSISDSYPEAMQSNSGKEEFLKQLEFIVEGARQSKLKVEQKLLEEKKQRDRLSSNLQVLVEMQRKYVSAVQQLSIECKRQMALLSKGES